MSKNIKLPLSGMKPVAIAALSRNVVSKMTGNKTFPTPAVDLKVLTEKINATEAAIDKAIEGSKISRMERDVLVEDLKVMLKTQANYVRTVCNGDGIMLASSGFELAKVPEKQPVPSSPVIQEVRMTGKQGQIEMKWNKQKGAKVYQVWMTDADPSVTANWMPVSATSKITTTIDNLQSYKAYWFCVSAIGAAGESAKSDVTIGRAA